MYNLMTIQFHISKGWKKLDVGVQVLVVVGGLQRWLLREQARGYPVLDVDSSKQFQLAPTQTQLSPSDKLLAPLGKCI